MGEMVRDRRDKRDKDIRQLVIRREQAEQSVRVTCREKKGGGRGRYTYNVFNIGFNLCLLPTWFNPRFALLSVPRTF